MKFISRISNYQLTLVAGTQGAPNMGMPPKPGIYVRFIDGKATISQPIREYSVEKLVELMKQHPSFGRDFVLADEVDDIDPYAKYRRPVEPEHDILELKHGSIDKNVNPRPKVAISPDKKIEFDQMVKEKAMEMAKTVLEQKADEMLQDILKKKMENITIPVTEGENVSSTFTPPPIKEEEKKEEDKQPIVRKGRPKKSNDNK